MLVLRYRLAVAGVISATAIAVPAVALASGPGSPSGKPTPAASASPSASKSAAAQSQLSALAASAGISVNQVETGLRAAKQAGGNTAAGVAAFAAATGVPDATAQRVLNAVFGTSSPGGMPAPVKSPAPGARTKSGPAQSQLNALAASAGISANQLEAGLAAMKQARGDTATGIAAFAARTGVSRATAQRIVNALTGT